MDDNFKKDVTKSIKRINICNKILLIFGILNFFHTAINLFSGCINIFALVFFVVQVAPCFIVYWIAQLNNKLLQHIPFY